MDEFKDIRDKFDDLEGTPPIGGWDRIKHQLPKKKRRPLFWLWLPFAAMFTGLVFLVGYYLGQSNANRQQSVKDAPVELAERQSTDQSESGNTVDLTPSSSDNPVSSNKPDMNSMAPSSVAPASNSNVSSDETTTEPPVDERSLIAVNTVVTSPGEESVPHADHQNTEFNGQVPNRSEPANNEPSVSPSSDIPPSGMHGSSTPDGRLNPERAFIMQSVSPAPLFDGASTILADEPTLTVRVDPDPPEPLAEPVPERFEPRWALDVYASALYNRKMVTTNPNDQVVIREFVSQEGRLDLKTGFDAGFNVRRQLSRRLSVFGGFGLTQLNDRIEYIVSEESDPEIRVLSNQSFSYSAHNRQRTRQVDIALTNVTVNAGIEYNLSPRLAVFTGLGLARLIAVNPGEFSNHVSPVNYYSMSGLSFIQPVNNSIDIKFQPVFNYYFRNIIREEFDMKAMNYGLRLVLCKH